MAKCQSCKGECKHRACAVCRNYRPPRCAEWPDLRIDERFAALKVILCGRYKAR